MAVDDAAMARPASHFRMLQRFWSWWITPRTRLAIRPVLAAGYVFLGTWMVVTVASYHDPDYGFTYLIGFGEEVLDRYDWRADRDVVIYAHDRSAGYDAQYYAQLAMDPFLQQPDLDRSIDNLPYRARRILVPWMAYVLGGGHPATVLDAFALLNLGCWLALGVVLTRWFPPTDLDRAFRWLGVMFSSGLCFSVYGALVDGPSLLLMALALRWWEQGHEWRATAVLALGGLAKETNLLWGGMVAPVNWKSVRGWALGIARGALILLPLVLWLMVLRYRLGDTEQVAGDRNFALPFVGYMQRWQELLTGAREGVIAVPFLVSSAATLISLTVQAAFLLGRWRWSVPAWRLCVPFAVLMLVLGGAVWEGHPGAAGRVLLPLLLGFNLLVPRGPKWWVVLLLGNLTLFSGPGIFQPRPGPAYSVQVVNHSGAVTENDANPIELSFPFPWHPPERAQDRDWRWAGGDADIVLTNHYDQPVQVVLQGSWSALSPRLASLLSNGTVLWQEEVGPTPVQWRLAPLMLPPGETLIRLVSDQPPQPASAGDSRLLSVMLKDLKVTGETVPSMP